MATNCGVWIDHRKAVIVLISDKGQEIRRIESGVARRAQPAGAASQNAYTPNDFVAEDRLERKVASQLKNFYDEVIDCTQGAEAILIIGPSEAKGELRKRLETKKGQVVAAELEAADKMTERQIAAKVRRHFSLGRASSPAQR